MTTRGIEVHGSAGDSQEIASLKPVSSEDIEPMSDAEFRALPSPDKAYLQYLHRLINAGGDPIIPADHVSAD